MITRLATAIGVDVQEKTTADLVDISRHVMCLSCSAPIVMDLNAMVSPPIKLDECRLDLDRVNPQIKHSHRHDDMQFMILTDEELAKFSDHPVLPGVVKMLMRTNEEAKKWRGKVYFGCKHCVPNPRKSSVV